MGYKIKTPTSQAPVEPLPGLSRGEQIWLFLEQHRTALLIGILLVVLAGAAVGVVFWLEHRNAEQALALEARATDLYQGPTTGQRQAEESEQKVGQAIELYQRIIDEYPRTASARRAMYLLGNAYMDQGEFDRAIQVYRDYLTTYPDQPLLLGLVYQRLGYAYSKSGDRDEASKAFAAVQDVPGALNKDLALLELGKLEEAQSRPEAALEHYERLVAQYPNSPLASEARLHIKALSPEEPEAEETEQTGDMSEMRGEKPEKRRAQETK